MYLTYIVLKVRSCLGIADERFTFPPTFWDMLPGVSDELSLQMLLWVMP